MTTSDPSTPIEHEHCGSPPPDEVQEETRPKWSWTTRTWSWTTRSTFLFTGVVLPLICFAMGPEQPTHQSGNPGDYAKLLLAHRPAAPLYPFLLCHMTCTVLLVVRPGRFAKSFPVRLGVYTGVVTALAYWIILAVAVADTEWPVVLGALTLVASIGGGVFWGVARLAELLIRQFGRVVLWPILAIVLLAVGIWLVVIVFFQQTVLLDCLQVLLFLCLACATSWAVASYAVMAVYVFRHSGVKRFRFSLAQLLGVFTWLAAYFGAWRTAANWMLLEYAKLPLEPPPAPCYVCTATARGHSRLVGSEEYVDASGRTFRVNHQMRCLKCAELLLACTCPRVHRACRRVYDRIGPVLAAALVYPLLADAAYLSLKPAEWLARAGLAVLLPDHRELVRRVYGRNQTAGKPAR